MVLGIISRDLRRLQEEDSGLLRARELAEGKTEEVSSGYFWREGLLFHKWTSPDGDKRPLEHIVLPSELRESVLHLAHTIPLAGHLGKKKTACGGSTGQLSTGMWLITAECQKSTHRRVVKVPMVPLPVIGEPFQHMVDWLLDGLNDFADAYR